MAWFVEQKSKYPTVRMYRVICMVNTCLPFAWNWNRGDCPQCPWWSDFMVKMSLDKNVEIAGWFSHIGCGSQNALNIDWPCWFTVVVTTLRPGTWPGTSTGSPTMTLDDVCDRQQHSSSRSLGRDSAQSAIGPFKSPVLVCEMRCLHRSSLLCHWLSSRVI